MAGQKTRDNDHGDARIHVYDIGQRNGQIPRRAKGAGDTLYRIPPVPIVLASLR